MLVTYAKSLVEINSCSLFPPPPFQGTVFSTRWRRRELWKSVTMKLPRLSGKLALLERQMMFLVVTVTFDLTLFGKFGFMFVFSFKDKYFQILTHSETGFCFCFGQVYQFRTMCFNLSSASQVLQSRRISTCAWLSTK